MRKATGLFLILSALLMMLAFPAQADQHGDLVYVLHIDKFQQIDPGLARIVRRAIDEVQGDPRAIGLVINIDTPGGYVTAALDMKDAIMSMTDKTTIAFVNQQAWSAGALIAISSEKLYMHAGGSIGAAEPRYATDPAAKADPKVVSALKKSFRAAAEHRGRDPVLAEAMVDSEVKAPGFESEDLLTLSAKQAVEAAFADGYAASIREAALLGTGRESVTLVDVTPTASENFARFLTTPLVATLLLVGGIIALGIEFTKPGIAVPGFIGIVLLGLFFAGNMMVGTAGWMELALMLLGLVLLVVEVFIPGFGIFGIGGIIAIVLSVFLAVPETGLALQYLFWMAFSFLGVLFVLLPTFAKRGLGKLLTLENTLEGTQSTDRTESLRNLIGQEGTALSTLRPAGTAEFGDRRIDVVTEGGYVEPGTAVVVLRVDGTRVVVRAKKP